jgi:quercetin dioxygenase-like cupin family protein
MKRLPYLLAAAAVAAGASLIPRAAGITRGAAAHETVALLAARPIPNVPGKRLVSILVDYPPGARSVAHRHASSAFIYAYVLSGEIRSRVDDEPARVYRKGEWWFENPGAHHLVSANASATRPARLLTVFIVDTADSELTTPDPAERTEPAAVADQRRSSTWSRYAP